MITVLQLKIAFALLQAELEVRYLEVELISASCLPSLGRDSDGQVGPLEIIKNCSNHLSI